ncbi:hypothetical protein HYALB_00002883 [Hymenoscyphus albidus]|uniref:Uncharacterized protein n=1 Tax=Hymenoscyphus albidus TaxID=595503 RepID=A0A9N9M2G4_9HELO|nr:hypothetical protein HYALB_00002883 [Hymenoscyphus albidus]
MAAKQQLRQQPSFRRDSPPPSPSPSPTPAIGLELTRCVSAGSGGSLFSGSSSSMGGRESMASSVGSSVSRSSSAGYSKRQSTGGLEQTGRRGYVRPQGTNFAKSAQSRESVLSLGSIMHLQYYFARTGLLDGKGGRLRKKAGDNRKTLDLSALDTSFLSPHGFGSDIDSSYASMGSSPELHAQGHGGLMVESPTQEAFYSDDEDEEDEDHPHMLPPTVSTYNHREKVIPHPPTLEELKRDLRKALSEATKVLAEAKEASTSAPPSPNPTSEPTSSPKAGGWYEIQGMHILDIMTLAIRAAKMYYTSHDQPARLAAIKNERTIRTELLSVMDVLKRMATRGFARGMRTEERETMEAWVESVHEMLQCEEEMEEEERSKWASWIWLDDNGPDSNSWEGREIERELAFIRSMDPDANTLPDFTPVDSVPDHEELPTPFLRDLRTGLRLVKLHNTLVRKSKRPFGAIDKWHTNFGKPYRPAENLIYWIKAAELRWEVILRVDVLAVVQGNDRVALKEFEEAIWKWCRVVREEITADIKNSRLNQF